MGSNGLRWYVASAFLTLSLWACGGESLNDAAKTDAYVPAADAAYLRLLTNAQILRTRSSARSSTMSFARSADHPEDADAHHEGDDDVDSPDDHGDDAADDSGHDSPDEIGDDSDHPEDHPDDSSWDDSDAGAGWVASCEATEDGGQACSFDDGHGTVCSVVIDASEQVVSEECHGDWGSYVCAATAEAIECALTSGEISCTDTWSLDYELVASSCAELFGDFEDDGDFGCGGDGDDGDHPHDGEAPDDFSEQCTTEGDVTTCSYDDGFCAATYSYAESTGFLLSADEVCGEFSQHCSSDEHGVASCVVTDGVESCSVVVDQAAECYLENTCEPHGPSDAPMCEAH